MRLGIPAKLAAKFAGLAATALFSIGAAPNWNDTYTVTEGGHLVGSPDAKIKLVGFFSYTCPHCSSFEKQAEVQLRMEYIHSGRLSLEIHNYVRDPVDLTVAMLTNCGPSSKFFKNHRAFMWSQDKWIGLMSTATKAQTNRWYSGNNAARRRAIAADFGFYTMMENRGYTRSALNKCLNNNAMATKLAAQTKADDEEYDISGTPSFTINGLLLFATHDWSMLRPQIEARL